MNLSGELLLGLAAGLAIAVLVFFIVRRFPIGAALTAGTPRAPDARIEQLATRVGLIEKQLQLTRNELEAALAQSIDSMRADVKLIQMQAQSVRSAAETDVVDLAVRLAREGLDGDEIARRTGLPKDLIESIRVLHKAD